MRCIVPASSERQVGPVGDELKVVGTPTTRLDAIDKLTGSAEYATDFAWPDTLFGAVVRAERAHAWIREIDSAGALERDGVVAVVTADNMVGLYPRFGHHHADHPILASDKVRYFGEPVAVVIASTPGEARDALPDVRVKYDDITPMTDARSAMADQAPLIHEDRLPEGAKFGACEAGDPTTNEAFRSELVWGDVVKALDAADVVVTTRNTVPMLYAYAMEPYAASARFQAGALEVVSGAQHPFQVQRELARIFSLKYNSVRIRVPYIGGGYGSKSYTKLEPLAAVCSHAVGGRPVKLLVSIEDSMYTTRADAAYVEVTSGFTHDGLLLARDIKVMLDTGAYADNSPQVLKRCATRGFGPYRVPSLRVRSHAVYTNTTPASSYRGFGTYHTNVASELNMDLAAEKLGIDRIELRLRNIVHRGETLVPGMRPVDADMAENLKQLAGAVDVAPKPGKLHGFGVACGISDAGANPLSMAMVRLLADGSVLLLTGSTEMGQGSKTALAQIAAEALGVELSQVSVVQGDTHRAPFQWTTGASRTTTISGLSVERACADVRRQVVDIVAQLHGVDPGACEWVGGQVRSPDGELHDLAATLVDWFGGPWGELVGVGRTERRGELAEHPAFWEVGMVGVSVDIDPETGQVELDQLITVGDVGRALNVAAVKGQEFGAATQAIGAALFEQLEYDGPQIVNSNLVDYRVPRMVDLPRRPQSILIERGDGIGPFGAKGVGEGAMTVAASAVFAAVANAVGAWPEEGPLTPERVWSLINGTQKPLESDFLPGRLFP